MKKYKAIISLFITVVILLCSGCSKTKEINDLETKRDDLDLEITETKSEIDEIKKENIILEESILSITESIENLQYENLELNNELIEISSRLNDLEYSGLGIFEGLLLQNMVMNSILYDLFSDIVIDETPIHMIDSDGNKKAIYEIASDEEGNNIIAMELYFNKSRDYVSKCSLTYDYTKKTDELGRIYDYHFFSLAIVVVMSLEGDCEYTEAVHKSAQQLLNTGRSASGKIKLSNDTNGTEFCFSIVADD